MKALSLHTQQNTYRIKQLQSNYLGVNQHYTFNLTIESTEQREFKPHQHAMIELAQQHYHGILTSISKPTISQDKRHYEYRVKLESPLAQLTNYHKRIFVDQSIQNILETLLGQLTFKYTENGFIKSFMQYNETDFECFERLIDQNKLFYYFDKDTLHITKQINPKHNNENFSIIETKHITTRTEQITELKTNHANATLFERMNDQLIISISHCAKRDAETLSYYNTLKLQTDTHSLHKTINRGPLPLQKASISKREATRYQVNYSWDTMHQNSQPIPVLQTGSQDKAGIHYPLQDQTEVCIAYLNNDEAQAIIIGAESPHKTHTHHRLHNHLHDGIVMKDAKDPATHISFGRQNKIKLNKYGVLFHTHSMQQHTNQNLLQITKGNYAEQSHTRTSHANSIKAYTQAGNMQFKIGKQLALHAQETISIKSKQEQRWKTKHIMFKAQHMQFNTAAVISCRAREMKITLSEHATLTSQRGNCTISNGASSIHIDASGTITVNAHTINVKSAQYCGFPPPPWL